VPNGQPTPTQIMLAVLPLLTVIGLLILGAILIWRKGKMAEMTHRERLAMIEKGLVPPPELSDLEKTMKALGPHSEGPFSETKRTPRERFRTVGVTTIGIGVALMLIIGVAGGAPESGIGVGGAIAALGVALVVNAYLDRGRPVTTRGPERLTMTPPREEPPAM
jgi:hypothetical protein